jgi:hypothetical protein
VGQLAVVPDLDAEIDRLFGLPPAEFTAARNDLALRLKRAGRREAAADVQSLRKPTVPVWTVNQLSRQNSGEVKALIEAAEELRASQERALGGGETSELRAATSAERSALHTLTGRAQKLLGVEGHAATIERVASTLRMAARDPKARERLENGRLTEELQASGFGALEGMSLPRGRRSRPSKGKAAGPRVDPRRQERLRRLKDRSAALKKQAAEAAREAKAAELAASRARRNAERAVEAAERARAELEAAEQPD